MTNPRHALFWFGTAYYGKGLGRRSVGMAVAAFTELGARRQIRKRLGPLAEIGELNRVAYANAWIIDYRVPPESVPVEAKRMD